MTKRLSERCNFTMVWISLDIVEALQTVFNGGAGKEKFGNALM